MGGENFTKEVTEQKWLSGISPKRAEICDYGSKFKDVLKRAKDGPTGLKVDQTDMEFVTNGIYKYINVKHPVASGEIFKK